MKLSPPRRIRRDQRHRLSGLPSLGHSVNCSIDQYRRVLDKTTGSSKWKRKFRTSNTHANAVWVDHHGGVQPAEMALLINHKVGDTSLARQRVYDVPTISRSSANTSSTGIGKELQGKKRYDTIAGRIIWVRNYAWYTQYCIVDGNNG